jgi:hypothetical protein
LRSSIVKNFGLIFEVVAAANVEAVLLHNITVEHHEAYDCWEDRMNALQGTVGAHPKSSVVPSLRQQVG